MSKKKENNKGYNGIKMIKDNYRVGNKETEELKSS